jgi:hypothetical protein
VFTQLAINHRLVFSLFDNMICRRLLLISIAAVSLRSRGEHTLTGAVLVPSLCTIDHHIRYPHLYCLQFKLAFTACSAGFLVLENGAGDATGYHTTLDAE